MEFPNAPRRQFKRLPQIVRDARQRVRDLRFGDMKLRQPNAVNGLRPGGDRLISVALHSGQ